MVDGGLYLARGSLRTQWMLFVIEKQNYRDLSHLQLNKLSIQKLCLEDLDLLMNLTKHFRFHVVLF